MRRQNEARIGEREKGRVNRSRSQSQSRRKKRKLTPLTPSYGHMSSACEWVSETQESAIDAEAQSRRSMAMIGDDWQRRYRRFNQTTGTLQLTSKQREEPADAEAGAEVDEKAEIDSIDSLICACGSQWSQISASSLSLFVSLSIKFFPYIHRELTCCSRHLESTVSSSPIVVADASLQWTSRCKRRWTIQNATRVSLVLE
jgi:hypothetical protein